MAESKFKTRIRSRIDGLNVENRTLAKGEEYDCPPDRAKVLIARGVAEPADAAAAERAAAVESRGKAPEAAVKPPPAGRK